MKTPISGGTRLIAVLGDPVSHSLSPRIQNAAITARGLDAVYVALRAGSASFPGLLVGLARAGGGGNVTIPHKQLAATLLERATPAVRNTGACNTFWLEDGRIHGDNTDVEGFAVAAREVVGNSLEGARVLILGAGGAARAALYALTQAGVDQVVVLNRTRERADALIASSPPAASDVRAVDHAGELRGQKFDLVVNATSLGLRGSDTLPLQPEVANFSAALDLVYAPTATPWVQQLRGLGIPAADGKEMLVRQGAASFKCWWGIDASLDSMREALSSPD